MKGMLLKSLKKYWVSVWMVSALLVLSVIVVNAAYTRVSISKRVVSTYSGAGVLFSSNYMESPAKPTIETPNSQIYTGTNHPTYIVNVCNYAQGDQAVWFDRKKISYTLKARIVNYSDRQLPNRSVRVDGEEGEAPTYTDPLGNKNYKIAKKTDGVIGDYIDLTDTTKTDNNGYYTFPSAELTPDRAVSDEYVVMLDNFDIENSMPTYVIEIIATPISTFSGAIPTEITGYIGIAQQTEAKANWVGEISDANYNSDSTYDAYNYVIYGSGKAVLNFMWDPAKIEVSQFFLNDYTPTDCVEEDNHNGWKKMVITRLVDDPERFDLQLYKTVDFTSISSAVDFRVDTYTPPANNENSNGQGNE